MNSAENCKFIHPPNCGRTVRVKNIIRKNLYSCICVQAMAFGRKTETNWVCRIAICHCDRRTNTVSCASCIRADCGGNLSSLEWHGLTGYSFVEYSVFTSRTEIDMKVMDCAIVHHSRPVNVTRVTRPLLCVRLMPLVKILFFCCQINYIVFFPLNWMFCLCFLSTSSKDT